MPNTSNGYPYPAGTDPVAGTATAIQNLATAVDTQLRKTAAGTVTINATAVGTFTASVTFPAGRFTAAPFVTTDANTAGPKNNISSANAVSAAGFTMTLDKVGGSTGNVVCSWIACG